MLLVFFAEFNSGQCKYYFHSIQCIGDHQQKHALITSRRFRGGENKMIAERARNKSLQAGEKVNEYTSCAPLYFPAVRRGKCAENGAFSCYVWYGQVPREAWEQHLTRQMSGHADLTCGRHARVQNCKKTATGEYLLVHCILLQTVGPFSYVHRQTFNLTKIWSNLTKQLPVSNFTSFPSSLSRDSFAHFCQMKRNPRPPVPSRLL